MPFSAAFLGLFLTRRNDLTVVHDGGRDVLAGDALSPRGRDVQVQLGLATVLTGIFLNKGSST